jgi:hypothetical protein
VAGALLPVFDPIDGTLPKGPLEAALLRVVMAYVAAAAIKSMPKVKPAIFHHCLFGVLLEALCFIT